MRLFKKKVKTPKNTDDQKLRREKLGKRFKFYKMPKIYTQNEWNQLKVINKKVINGKEFYLDLHEVLCNKYDIVLIDYRINKEVAVSIIKAINFKNFDKGMKIFDDAMKEFDKAMKDFGKELGDGSGISQEKITGKKLRMSKKLDIWGSQSKTKSKQIDVWSTKKAAPKRKRKPKKKSTRNDDNLSMIWGKKK